MYSLLLKRLGPALLALVVLLGVTLTPITTTRGADHGDAPAVDADRTADIADVFAFLDPNDNTKLVLEMTFNGFIVSGELLNFGGFDPTVRYVFNIDTTGGQRDFEQIFVQFAPKTGPGASQTATVILPFGQTFTAPSTPVTLNATAGPFVVTTDANSGASFFAGVTDDPFFFDIPAFNRFVASAKAGAPNTSFFQRGRDSFAGYNVNAIAIELPISSLRIPVTSTNSAGNVIGVYGVSQRQAKTVRLSDGTINMTGGFRQVDRMGNPAINVALINFADKDAYNAASPVDDVAGKFVPDIVGNLTTFGTNATNIGILASVAVTNGDLLHLNLTVPNSGPGGGNNAPAGFPNGRRLADNTIDTILFFIANQNKLTQSIAGNDVPLTNTFPFLGFPQQPRDSGTDDNTRN